MMADMTFRMGARLLAAMLLLTVTAPAHAQSSLPQIAPEARAYLETALDSLETLALRRHTTDWRTVRDSAFVLAAGAQRVAQVHGALAWALQRVDRHSFLQAPFPWVEPELVAGSIGYLRVPLHTVSSKAALADTLQHVLRDLESRGACGWIVDLRMNGGGNVWPMYAGIGPLLGDSVLNARLRNGKLVTTAFYIDGAAIGVDDDGERVVAAQVDAPYRMQRPDAPVAVLIDGGTGSSAEALAIALRTRPHTRFFGQPTAGYTTANRGVALADGANMVVTIEAMRDIRGREYADPIEPDELVVMPAGFWPSSADAVSRAAQAWLAQQSACTRE